MAGLRANRHEYYEIYKQDGELLRVGGHGEPGWAVPTQRDLPRPVRQIHWQDGVAARPSPCGATTRMGTRAPGRGGAPRNCGSAARS